MEEKFVTLVACMDGRIQLSSNKYMQKKYKALYVDTITEAGPCKIISDYRNMNTIENIKARLDLSINTHQSKAIGVVGHFDCAAIQDSDNLQKQLIVSTAKIIKNWYPDIEVIALWANENFEISEL